MCQTSSRSSAKRSARRSVRPWSCRSTTPERAAVAQLNQLARAHLVHHGHVHRRSRTYRSADDSRAMGLAVGDEVILRRNDTRLAQPGGRAVAVRNGMTGRITRTDRRSITVQLDPEHTGRDDRPDITLPAPYVGANIDYAYARTVDTAQGATVDHSLFAPSPSTSAERAYVALSRGRLSNRIYTTTDPAWVDALATRRTHTFATNQQPETRDGGYHRHPAIEEPGSSTHVSVAIAEPDRISHRRQHGTGRSVGHQM